MFQPPESSNRSNVASTLREHWNSMHGAQRRLPSRIKQESRNSRRKRVLSASRIKFKDKRSQGTLVFSSPRRRHPLLPRPPFASSSRSRFCSRSNSRSLLFITIPRRASHSALLNGRNIARNNVKYLPSGRLFPSVRRDKHHYVMYIKTDGDRSAQEYAGGGRRINFCAPLRTPRIYLARRRLVHPSGLSVCVSMSTSFIRVPIHLKLVCRLARKTTTGFQALDKIQYFW